MNIEMVDITDGVFPVSLFEIKEDEWENSETYWANVDCCTYIFYHQFPTIPLEIDDDE